MADNAHYYGFRWSRSRNGKGIADALPMTVATGQDDQDDSSNSVDLNIGDPVKLVSTGGVTLSLTTNSTYGIIAAVAPYWDGDVMRPSKKLPNQTAWGTIEDRRSMVYVIPASWGIWEIDVDDKTTATTKAGYVALYGNNANHVVPGDTANTSADPMLDISSAATTAALDWRLLSLSPTMANQDLAGSYVKVLVAANTSEEAGWAATTIAGV